MNEIKINNVISVMRLSIKMAFCQLHFAIFWRQTFFNRPFSPHKPFFGFIKTVAYAKLEKNSNFVHENGKKMYHDSKFGRFVNIYHVF